jgi:hypothetical protein
MKRINIPFEFPSALCEPLTVISNVPEIGVPGVKFVSREIANDHDLVVHSGGGEISVVGMLPGLGRPLPSSRLIQRTAMSC